MWLLSKCMVLTGHQGHHLDLYFPTAGDPETVVDARKTEAAMIRIWCQQYYDERAQRKS